MGRPASLQRYHAKRDFTQTSEPRGTVGPRRGNAFVVQQHAARRMHYDLRLQLGEVLKSWAIPKGPSLDPQMRRLAVQTEDHPLAYASFEGTIPQGAYGGGKMIVWDEGRWQARGDAAAGLRAGKLTFTLQGHKLAGAWQLVRTHTADKAQWLLRKVSDAAARPGDDVTARLPHSVRTHRRVEDVGEPHPAASTARPAKARQRAAASPLLPQLPPDLVRPAPQLATLAATLPTQRGWLYEVKLDGYRLLACRIAGTVRLWSRNGHDWTRRLAPLAAAVAALPGGDVVLDGELVQLDAAGRSDFAALQQTLAQHAVDALQLCAFDLLLDGAQDVRTKPLTLRKALLQRRLAKLPAGTPLRYWPHVRGAAAGTRALAAVRAQRLEGLVAKQAAAPYVHGRDARWLKVKCTQRQAFVVVGFVAGSAASSATTGRANPRAGGDAPVRALLLGGYDAAAKLRYVGRVASGIAPPLAAQLQAAARRQPKRRADAVDAPSDADARYVRPTLVVEVQFAERTARGGLRHASVVGVRQDKAAKEAYFLPPSAEVAEEPSAPPRAGSKAALTLTHPNRPVLAGSDVTKAKLVAYMQAVAPLALPYLGGRPLSVVRFPEGDVGRTFVQKHFATLLPGLAPVACASAPNAQLVSPLGLVALVQHNVLELHPWGARADAVETVDTLTFDLDPGEGVQAAQVVAAAHAVRAVLRSLGLRSHVKATGGKGLHVVVMGLVGCGWPVAKAFAHIVADYMAAREPGAFTASLRKAARRGKIFVDYLRNGRGATAVGVYSPRARPGLPVARPLRWRELDAASIEAPWDVPQLLAALRRRAGDPWRGARAQVQRVPAEVQREALAYAARRA